MLETSVSLQAHECETSVSLIYDLRDQSFLSLSLSLSPFLSLSLSFSLLLSLCLSGTPLQRFGPQSAHAFCL